MQEIHLQLPKPGQWNEFVMTARFPDNNGFVLSLCYTPVSYTHLDVYKRQDIYIASMPYRDASGDAKTIMENEVYVLYKEDSPTQFDASARCV